jgi:hypothetical protein
MERRRVLLAYAFLALLVVGAGGALAIQHTTAFGHASPCASPAAERDPMLAATRFVQSAVARVHVERSYWLVTPSLREDLTCADWMTGSIPVQPFLQIKWRETGMRVVQRDERRIVVLVALRSHATDWPPSSFYLELLAREGRWLANGWSPAGAGAVPAASG